ncbi:SGNH/GDSL hydrolase family protein [soil metagenome]
MTSVLQLALRGAVSVSGGSGGVTFDRLPAEAHSRYGAIRGIREASTQASGVRLELRTAATWMELDLAITRYRFDPSRPAAPAVVVATLEEGTSLEVSLAESPVHTFAPPDVDDVQPGVPETARFSLGGDGSNRAVTVWLPHTAAVRLLDLRADRTIASAPRSGPRWTHYGSSISHCIEARTPLDVWPVVAARELGLDLTSLGIAGQAHLDPFAADAIAAAPADVISLEVGINIVGAASMRERTFVPAMHGFLDRIRSAHPAAPLLLISPIICPALENEPGPAVSDGTRIRAAGIERAPGDGLLTVTRVRDLLIDVVASRGDAALLYLDGRELFGAVDLDHLFDGVHPDSEGYRRIGHRFVTHTRRLGWMADS